MMAPLGTTAVTVIVLIVALVDGRLPAAPEIDEVLVDGRPPSELAEVETAFEDFMRRFDKSYSAGEREKRFEIFMEKYERIKEHTSKANRTFDIGVNIFSDMTREESAAMFRGFKYDNETTLRATFGSAVETHVSSGADLAKDVDLRNLGAVRAVRNQGTCGGCWSFTAMAAVEGAWYLATKQKIDLSTEQLVDCDRNDKGCDGGSIWGGLDYGRTHGLCTFQSYQYNAPPEGQCKEDHCSVAIPRGGVIGMVALSFNSRKSVSNLMEAISTTPVGLAVDGQGAFMEYTGGVFDQCGTKINHAVLGVGYGSDPRGDYWLIKNSWGTHWGEDGFGRISRSTSRNRFGECMVLYQPVYPRVNGDVRKWMYSVPWGIVFTAVAVLVAGLICLVSQCKKRHDRSRRGRAPTLGAGRGTQVAPYSQAAILRSAAPQPSASQAFAGVGQRLGSGTNPNAQAS
eukprot:TRINITY_DN19348_c0_g1_i1.p1 TRINITY_DN19348_c0_g1~~TRINITY_DN19348_c0_g1_i1.p1  ORF type:complete len:503 (-),score=47.39 TRINITY_DN19348_c0_g1_i1:121-1488(-)